SIGLPRTSATPSAIPGIRFAKSRDLPSQRIVTLALVLAAVTSVVGWMRSTMYGNRPGAHHTEALVDFVIRKPNDAGLSEFLSYPTYKHLRERTSAFTGMAAYTGLQMYRLRSDAITEGGRLAALSGNDFCVLDVIPRIRRLSQ